MVRRYITNLFKVQLGIFILVLLLITTEQLRFLEQKEADLTTTLTLIFSSAPQMLTTTFPLVILLSSLFTYLGLARSSELVIVRASGISALRILIPPIITTLLIGLVIVTVFNPIVAASIRKNDEIRQSFSKTQTSQLSISEDGLWLRQTTEQSHFVIQASSSSNAGTILYNVRFHEFSPTGILIRRIEAETARLFSGEWRLYRVKQWRFLDFTLKDRTDVRPFTELRIPTELTRDKILEGFTPPEKISIWDIPSFIKQLKTSGFSTVKHDLFFQSQLSMPILLTAMFLIGAVFSLRPARFGHTGVMALLAVMSGFLLFSLNNVAESLGEAQEVSIGLAAWAPPIAAILFVTALILHLEDG